MNKKCFYLSHATLAFAACNEPLNDTAEIETSLNESSKTEEQGFILGKKLNNPYSLSTMRLAYKQIKGLSKSCPTDDSFIKATHLYIKFSPKNEEEFDLITSDTLTHAMHWDWSNCYNSTDDIVKESLCRGVEYVFSKNIYGKYDESRFLYW